MDSFSVTLQYRTGRSSSFCLAIQCYKISGIDYGTKLVAIDLKFICSSTWLVTNLCTFSDTWSFTYSRGHI
jgi:hypothetical protein